MEMTNDERLVLFQLCDLGIKAAGINVFQGKNAEVIQSALAKIQPKPEAVDDDAEAEAA